MSVIDSLRPQWPWIAGAVSAALLAGAHAFQRFGGLAPCPLCLDQRDWHWAVLGAAVLSVLVVRFRPGLARWTGALIGVLFVASFVQGAHHVAVEHGWVIAQCDVGDALGDLTFDVNAELEAPQCDQVAWSFLGVSLAGYNALISLLMALASFAVALWPAHKP